MTAGSRRTLLLGAVAVLAAPELAAQERTRPLVVSSKLDIEGASLGEMIASTLERWGVPVERRLQLGPTRIVRGAMLAGEVDLYPEYAGNGAFFFQMEDDPAWHDAAAVGKVRSLDAERNDVV